MKSLKHMPIFTSGHPLMLSTSLASRGYKPIVYTLKRDIIKVARTKMVFILLSIYDSVSLKEALINVGFFKARLIAFVSWKELKKYSSDTLPGERFSKKDIDDFVPEFVNIETLKEPGVPSILHQDFVQEFNSSIQILHQRLLPNRR